MATAAPARAITDSPFFSALNCACLYNAPYFDATDPENRNNKQLTGSVTKFWNLGGRHETKGGYEWFRSQRTGGNSQSSTSYVFSPISRPTPTARRSSIRRGRPIPVFVPGTSFLDYYPAVRGAVLNVDNNSAVRAGSLDHQRPARRPISARATSTSRRLSTGDISQRRHAAASCRASAWPMMLMATATRIVHVNYGQYSGRYNEAQIGAEQSGRQPARHRADLSGAGRPGLQLRAGIQSRELPDQLRERHGLGSDAERQDGPEPDQSPLVHEFSASFGTKLHRHRGYGEVSYVARITHDLIEDYQTLADRRHRRHGQRRQRRPVHQQGSTRTRRTIRSTGHYQGLVFQSRYRVNERLERQRSRHGAAAEQRQLRGRGHQSAGQHLGDRQLSRGVQRRRGRIPFGDLQNFERTACGCGAFTAGTWVRKATSRSRGCGASNQVWLTASRRKTRPLTTQQVAILASAGYPDQPGPQTVFFTGERGDQNIRRLWRDRHVDQLRRPGVPFAEAVGEARRLQPVQQREADRMEHDGDRRTSRRRRRQPRAADQLHDKARHSGRRPATR